MSEARQALFDLSYRLSQYGHTPGAAANGPGQKRRGIFGCQGGSGDLSGVAIIDTTADLMASTVRPSRGAQ